MASKFNNVDINVINLVYGYIRLLKITTQIIPSSIVELCVKFYHSNLRILCIKHNHHIKVAELDTKKHFELIPVSLSDNPSITLVSHPFIHTSMAVCYVKDFILPENLLPKDHKLIDIDQTIYDVIFCVGGGSWNKGNIFHSYIIDAKQYNIHDSEQINSWHWPLPLLSQNVSQIFVTYSNKHGLIMLGGSNNISSFNILRFDDENMTTNSWKWQENSLKTERDAPCATMICDDQLICCGGGTGGANVSKYVDMYDFDNKKWTQLCDMYYPRRYAGIAFDKFNERVFVGGGGEATQQVEYYNINKDKWISLPDTNGKHERWPIIWTDNKDIINIASTWCKMFESIDLRENKWNIVDSDNTNAFDNLFGTIKKESYIKKHDFHSRLCIYN